MIAREYNKRVSVYDVELVSNPFGGNTPIETLLFTSWAKLETNGVGYKAVDFGLDSFENPLFFKVRYRNDFKWQGRTLFVLYRNERYVIKGIKNVNQANLELEIYCAKQETELP